MWSLTCYSPFLQILEHTFPKERKSVRFFYTHGQLLIRASLERKLAGLPDIGTEIDSDIEKTKSFPLVPLDLEEKKKDLGPGYGIGYWAPKSVTERPNQCRVSRKLLKKERRRYDQLLKRRWSSMEEWKEIECKIKLLWSALISSNHQPFSNYF